MNYPAASSGVSIEFFNINNAASGGVLDPRLRNKMCYRSPISTPLGIFTLAADNKGLTGISLPGSTVPITRQEQSLPSGVQVNLDMAAEQVTEYCTGKRRIFELPLSLKGTDFQQQVWEQIKAIPYGRTMSYGEIARKLGNANKARAVGGAAHANPLPLVIPCHRVVGTTGSLTGFAGGLELKKLLLELEGNVLARNP